MKGANFHKRCGYCLERRSEQFAFINWGLLFKKNKVTRDHAENENEEERKDEFHADRMINYARRCINTFVLSRRTFSSRVQLSILSCCPSFKNNFIALL